jgi:hypothetical protein
MRQIRFLVTEIEIGMAFVESARQLHDLPMKAQILSFARYAHDTTARLLVEAPVKLRELRNLERGLDRLRQAIAECTDGGSEE